MDDKCEGEGRPDMLFVSPADAEKIAPLASGSLTLEDLERAFKMMWETEPPCEIISPAEYERRQSDPLYAPVEKVVVDLAIGDEIKFSPRRFDRASLPRKVWRGEVYPWKPIHAFSEPEKDSDDRP